MTSLFVKPEERPVVAENGASDYNWGSLPLAIQLILPLAIITLIIGRRGIGIRSYPVLDTYISLICPSFKQRQRLLKWMSDRIPHMPNKIAEYWKDGSLLCTLINTAVPGACPNPQRHWHQPPSHGQALAFKYLGVTPVLTEEHFKEKVFNSQIEKSYVKYLLAVQDAIAKLDVKENTELKYTSKYIARGMGLFTGEKNRASIFYIYPNSRLKKMQNVLINVKGPYSTYGTKTISAQHIFRTLGLVKKVQKDVRREQNKLTIPSKAQRSFFRSLSIDLGPLANIISNRRNSGGIQIKVEMEEGRAKVSFIPPHTGVYELCLTTDGEHLTGSPFNIRVIKNETSVVDSFEPNKKSPLRKTGKIVSKCISFINESVHITNNNNIDYFGNANQNKKSNLTLMASTKILCKLDEDTNLYEQDSGVYDTNESISDFNDIQQNDTYSLNKESGRANCETAVPRRTEEILETSAKETNNRVAKKNVDDALDKVKVSTITPEEALQVISNMVDLSTKHVNEEDDDIKMNFQNTPKDSSIKETNNLEERIGNLDYDHQVNLKQSVKDKPENINEKDTFGLLDLQSNTEFEDLYNKYVKNEENADEPPPSTPTSEISRGADSFEMNTELRLLKKVSNVRAVKQKFENDSPKISMNPDLITCHSQRNPKHFQTASPVSQGIEQEVESSRSAKDATHPSQDGASSLAEERKRLPCVENEVNEINVVEIRTRFESKDKADKELKRKTLQKNNCNIDLLKETKKHLAVSLPNLIVNDLSRHTISSTGSNSLESISSEDENMSQKFRERYQFWNKLVQRNSKVSGLNLAASDFGSSDSFIRTKINNLKVLSRSTYSLERKSENAENVKTELKKQLSTDEMIFPSVKERRNYYLNNINQKEIPRQKIISLKKESIKESITEIKASPHVLIEQNCDETHKRKNLICDRVKVFEKASDLKKKEPVTPKYQKTILLCQVQSSKSVTKSNVISEPSQQHEEDIEFADVMRQRFEKSRQYFKSLEAFPTIRKSNGSPRRSSLDTSVRKVSDRFSLDNLYRDVISEKIKRSSFKGSPNRCAVAETLASISSRASSFEEADMEDNDLDLKYFQIKKKTRERKSIRSLFDINY